MEKTENEKIEPALYLIPVTLGESAYEKVLPECNRKIIGGIKNFIVESRKCAVRFLKFALPEIDIDSLNFFELNEHTNFAECRNFLQPLLDGFPMGVISDAGCPAVADPGAFAVKIAQEKNLKVVPLVGPSSILMALMASGFNGQNFSFNGYLPAKPSERCAKIRRLEERAWKENQTQIFIEAPYRNEKLFESILKTCRKETKICVACGITTGAEFIRSRSVEEWRKNPAVPFEKIPAIFLIYGGEK